MSFKTIAGLTLIASACLAGPRGQPAQEGIANFGKVNEFLFRGAQPDPAGIESLKRLGVKLIVNLRMTNEAWQGEAANARANGIAYTNVPMSGLGRPTAEQIKTVLSIIESSPGPVFVHCQHGCDRTGTIIACYRVRHDNWSSDEALREAARYGMSRLERGMKEFVAAFAKTAGNGAGADPAPGGQSARAN
jgi:protein tyrosine/serine phosphatase